MFTLNLNRDRRLVDHNQRQRRRSFNDGDGLADGDAFHAGHGHDVAHRGFGRLGPLQSGEREQLGDARLHQRSVALRDVDVVARVQRSLKDAADGDAAKVVGVIEIGNENLQRCLDIARGRWNRRHNGLEQRLQVRARLGHVERRRACLGHCVEHRKIQLRFLRIEVDEKVVNLVQHFLRTRIGAVNLVDHHDRLELGFQRLGQHVARLRQRPLGRIHQQHHAVHHLQRALHLAAKIGVARRIDNVDLAAFKVDGRILGKDGDAALALQVVRIHHALGHLLVGAEGAGLAQHGVNEGGLAVVNMGDDGDIAYRLGHRCSVPSLLGQIWICAQVWPSAAIRLGMNTR